MTDTMTITQAEATAAAAEQANTEMEALITTEAEAFERRKTEIAEVAHQLGTDHDIGSALDDLLDEFDMPRRAMQCDVYVDLTLLMPVNTGRQRIDLVGGRTFYLGAGTQVTSSILWSDRVASPDGEACACAAAPAAIRDWLVQAYSRELAEGASVQIGKTRCDGDDCEAEYFPLDPSTGIQPGFDVIRWSDLPETPQV